MLWWVWIGLATGAAAALAGLGFAAVRGLAAWRGFKRTSADLRDRLAALGGEADAVAAKVEALAEGSARLQEALARLATSRARLRVLLQAIEDVRDTFGRITAVVPRK